MPSKAKNNGAAPLAQPPVRTLAVPEYLRPRIEAAHKRIEEEHPGGLSLQKLVEVFILCGLEAIEIETDAHFNDSIRNGLQFIAAPDAMRRTQKEALAFLRWYCGGGVASPREVTWDVKRGIEAWAPHLLDYITKVVVDPDDPALVAFREAAGVKPGVIERFYEDSVQEPLTASEQGRD